MFVPFVASQEVPSPVTILSLLREMVIKDEARGKVAFRLWGLTRSSWSATWGQGAFGVDQTEGEDTSAFGFRVPPDSSLKRYASGSPFLVEGYRSGFPTWGVRRDGDAELCRPLGFVYGPDGLCRNATVFEMRQGRWRKLLLKARTKTLLARRLNFDSPAKIGDFGSPWYRIVAEGYGTYWVDRSLTCIGPFGIVCKLLPDKGGSIGEMLAGKWEKTNGPVR